MQNKLCGRLHRLSHYEVACKHSQRNAFVLANVFVYSSTLRSLHFLNILVLCLSQTVRYPQGWMLWASISIMLVWVSGVNTPPSCSLQFLPSLCHSSWLISASRVCGSPSSFSEPAGASDHLRKKSKDLPWPGEKRPFNCLPEQYFIISLQVKHIAGVNRLIC